MNGTLDHVMVTGSDLETVSDALAEVGLAPTYGGEHEATGTEMALVGFEDGSYLEGIAPTDPESPPEGWPEGFFSAGACRWSLCIEDVEDELDRLRDAGAVVRGPEAHSRERPDGTSVEYETATVGTEALPMAFPFLVSDVTPRSRRVQPSDGAETPHLSGIAEVVVAVPDLAVAVEEFRRLYALSSPRRAADEVLGARLASFPDAPLTLAEPRDDASWLATRVEAFPGWVCAVMLGTTDFAAATDARPTTGEGEWFGSRVCWLDVPDVGGRIGLLER